MVWSGPAFTIGTGYTCALTAAEVLPHSLVATKPMLLEPGVVKVTLPGLAVLPVEGVPLGYDQA